MDSNLFLQNKLVRASAPDSVSFLADSPADSWENSDGNPWDALRASHILASSKPICSILVCLYDFARTYFIKNSWSFKLRVWWLISIPPRPSLRSTTALTGCPSASAVSRPPSPTPCPCFFCFAVILIFFFRYGHGVARDGFLLEGETGGIHSVVILFFVVLKMDSVLPKLFSGDLDFAKPRLILFLHFVRAEEGFGEESARTFWIFFQRR